MKTKINQTSPIEIQLDIEADKTLVKQAFEEKVKEYSKKLQLKGFRQGKIPKRVIIERFEKPIKSETIEKVINDSISQSCQDHKIQALNISKVDNLIDEDNKPFSFTAIIEVDHDLKITDYKNLDITLQTPQSVSEQDINDQLLQHTKSIAEQKDYTEKKAQNGTLVVGKYLNVTIDNKDHTPQDPSVSIEVGVSKISEFNKALLNSKIGDKKKIKVKYPKDYEVKELQGKKGIYELQIEGFKELIMPSIDDELAKKLGAENLKTLKKNITKNLKMSRKNEAEQKNYDQAIDKVLEKHPLQIPNVRVEHYIKTKLKSYQNQVEDGKEVDLNTLPKDYREFLEKEGVRELQKHIIISQVSQQEKIKASQEEVDKKIDEMAEHYGIPATDLKEMFRKDGRIQQIRDEIKFIKTLEFLTQN